MIIPLLPEQLLVLMVGIADTSLIRLVFLLFFGIAPNPVVIGIAFAMCLDWIVCVDLFFIRLRSGRWKRFRVI